MSSSLGLVLLTSWFRLLEEKQLIPFLLLDSEAFVHCLNVSIEVSTQQESDLLRFAFRMLPLLGGVLKCEPTEATRGGW